MDRAEISRRKLLREQLAKVLCTMAGHDPNRRLISQGGRWAAVAWQAYGPKARRMLEAAGWPETLPAEVIPPPQPRAWKDGDMVFITVRRLYKNAPEETTIRGDHLLQMNAGKADGHDGTITWLLIQHTGWMPVLETQEEIKAMIAEAEHGVRI